MPDKQCCFQDNTYKKCWSGGAWVNTPDQHCADYCKAQNANLDVTDCAKSKTLEHSGCVAVVDSCSAKPPSSHLILIIILIVIALLAFISVLVYFLRRNKHHKQNISHLNTHR